jgi:hypothetical protein
VLHAVVVTPAELRRAYWLNLAVASVFAGGGGFAWRMEHLAHVRHPWLWWVGGLACQILALIFLRETMRYRRQLDGMADDGGPSRASGPVGLYRGFYALFDRTRTGLLRLVNAIGGLLSIGLGGALAWFAWYHWRDFLWLDNWPVASEWLAKTWFLPFGSGLVFVLMGLGVFVEAFRFMLRPGSVPVHGAARPADAWEAQAAARGNVGTAPMHDQQFRD